MSDRNKLFFCLKDNFLHLFSRVNRENVKDLSKKIKNFALRGLKAILKYVFTPKQVFLCGLSSFLTLSFE